MSEIERLREHLKVIEQYEPRMYALAAAKAEIGNRIAELEAAADPWREAKEAQDWLRDAINRQVVFIGATQISKYLDHRTAEVARLGKRVEEFRHGLACMVSTYGKIDERSEIAVKHARKLIECEGEEIDVAFDAKDIADMQPQFEGPIESIEPILDPARVLATAVELGWGPTVYAEMTLLRDAKPYRLKGTDDGE